MPAALALGIGLVVGLLSGGKLRNLEDLQVRYPYVVLGAFVLQGLARQRVPPHDVVVTEDGASPATRACAWSCSTPRRDR